MRVKKKRKFQRGGGVFTNPSGTEIPSGWGVKTKKPSVGGYGYFLELHIQLDYQFSLYFHSVQSVSNIQRSHKRHKCGQHMLIFCQ